MALSNNVAVEDCLNSIRGSNVESAVTGAMNGTAVRKSRQQQRTNYCVKDNGSAEKRSSFYTGKYCSCENLHYIEILTMPAPVPDYIVIKHQAS